MISKIKFSVIALFFMLLFFRFDPLHAAWWDGNNAVPLPPGAKQAMKENRRIGGADMTFTYYTGDSSPGQIKDFYRKKLALSGWQEKNLSQDIAKLQMPNINQEMVEKAFENNLYFEKDGETLIINFLPGGYTKDNQTRFTVAQGRVNQKAPSSDAFAVPELIAKPKKDVFPVYPGASLMTLAEKADFLKASYFSKDDSERVAEFYREKMGGYGWELVSATPLQKMTAPAQECPTCPKGVNLPTVENVETWAATMEFTDQKGDSCTIGITEVITPGAGQEVKPMAITTITVDYNAKSN